MLIITLDNNASSRAGIDIEVVGITTDFHKATQICLDYVILESLKIGYFLCKFINSFEFREEVRSRWTHKHYPPCEHHVKLGKKAVSIRETFSEEEVEVAVNQIKQHCQVLKDKFLAENVYNPLDIEMMNDLLKPFLSKLGVARRFFTVKEIEIDKATNSLP
jgi:hypothetical protein